MANAYGQSQARVSLCVGPTGGGKTTESVWKCLRVAQWQHASPRDGIRRARIKVVTPTYRKAWDSVIPSYRNAIKDLGVLDAAFGKWTGGAGEPAKHQFQVRWPGYGILELEILFRAINDQGLEDFVRGDEVTAWWIPEADTLPEDLIPLALNRVGRWPMPNDRPVDPPNVSYAGVFGDLNVPDLDSWFYNKMWLAANRPDHWHLFRQPPGLLPDGLTQNPAAENLANLMKIDPNFYPNQARDMEKWAVRRFLMCRPGHSRFGEPVHDDFDDELHVATATIPVDPQQPILIGVDGGGNTMMPGATFGQRDYQARWGVLAEFSPTAQTNVDELGTEILRVLNVRVRRAKGALITIDPAAAIPSPQSPYTYAQQLQAKTGIEVRMAPTNDPQRRRAALKKPLQQTVAGKAAFQVDPSCTGLIKGLAGGFSYARKDKAKGVLRPVKNQSSHVTEACEYMVMTGDGVEGFFGGAMGIEGPEGSDLYHQVVM